MKKAHVPIVPGSDGEIESEEEGLNFINLLWIMMSLRVGSLTLSF